jgi:DeoR family transcriptional regulator, suf operon transcriptional repressor
MSALITFGQRQQLLLKALLHKREGMTVDELSLQLEISRNAVNQHISSLENNGFLENSSMTSTGGRPSKIYTLTTNGLELFPKHYALFSNLLIHWIKDKIGQDELKSCLSELGKQVAQEFKVRVQEHKILPDKISEVAMIMHELGYEARVETPLKKNPEIIANNCVFHQLADECNEVCELDLTLLSTLLDTKIIHKECMVKGGSCCRFEITKKL